MPRPRRFTLAALMLLITGVAVVFGYAAWRKRNLLKEVAELKQSTTSVIEVSDGWFWPPVREPVMLTLRQDGAGAIFDGDSAIEVDELKARYSEFSRRLNAIGVRDVHLGFVREKDVQGKTVLEIKAYESFDQYAKRMQ